jgi:hypothetical protein
MNRALPIGHNWLASRPARQSADAVVRAIGWRLQRPRPIRRVRPLRHDALDEKALGIRCVTILLMVKIKEAELWLRFDKFFPLVSCLFAQAAKRLVVSPRLTCLKFGCVTSRHHRGE